MTNMVMLGALIATLPVLEIENIEQSIIKHLPDRHKNLLPSNLKAIKLGAEFVEEPQTI